MSNTPPNQELLDALALHYDDLVRYIKQRFRDRHFARDLVHDVYLQILDKPPRDRVSLPLAFLRKVTFNRAIDRVRAEALRTAHLAANSHDEPVLDSWDGARELDFEQQLLAVAGELGAVQAVEPRAMEAWRSSVLRFDGTPLRDAVVDLQRYSELPLRLADERTGRLRLSGEFDSRQVRALLEQLPAVLPVTVVRAADGGLVIGRIE